MSEKTCEAEQVPVLHVRGTHYEIGFSIGSTFGNLIRNFFQLYKEFQNNILPFYESEEGKTIYNMSLKAAKTQFPQYVQEIQGMADGSGLPFCQLFLLHIEALIPESSTEQISSDAGSQGCTSLITNTSEALLLCHTEDASTAMASNFYMVSAEVLSEDRSSVVEKFTTLTYPGYLPGGTMGFNNHGIVHSVNSIYIQKRFPGRTPYLFLLRAVLGAKSMAEVEETLRDVGSGTDDGFSVNVISANEKNSGEAVKACNIEVSPNQAGMPHSDLYLHETEMGRSDVHCNIYLRCPVAEVTWSGSSSPERHETLRKFRTPYDFKTAKEILSVEIKEEGRCSKYSIFKRSLGPSDHYETIAVGIFDIIAKKWYVYKKPPENSAPVVVIPL